MAQINLLKQAPQNNDRWKIIPKVLAQLFAAVLLGLIVYYAWLFFQSKAIDTKIADIKSQINMDRESAFVSPERDELLVRQTQLQDLSGLISNHVYLSQLMPVLADATLKTAAYSSLAAQSSGNLTLSVTVPSIEELDKYLQVFDLPQVNKYFSNVRIGDYHKVNGNGPAGIAFQVNMQFDPAIIHYSPANASTSASN